MRPVTLAERLRIARHRKGWTVRQAAAAAGVGTGTLSEVERGNRPPTERVRDALAEAYGLDPEELRYAGGKLEPEVVRWLEHTPGARDLVARLRRDGVEPGRVLAVLEVMGG